MKRKVNKTKIIFTDLDRTLLKDDSTFSKRSINALIKLRENSITTVIATGRNIFSAKKVLNDDFPIDYLIFSSGAGIIDWKMKEIVSEDHLSRNDVISTAEVLIAHNVDFMIHDTVPDNHEFLYYKIGKRNPDFLRRLKIYEKFAKPVTFPFEAENASQLIAILPKGSENRFDEIKAEIKGLKVIRATSPLDHKSIWLEVFPQNVSKGKAAEKLCKKLSISQENTVGIGNDYNDLDLLAFTHKSFVVANSPDELKKMYEVTKSNEEDGFAEVVEGLLTDQRR
jgi:Cof subfamily protein (haloacid dehalogenase superfamily)